MNKLFGTNKYYPYNSVRVGRRFYFTAMIAGTIATVSAIASAIASASAVNSPL